MSKPATFLYQEMDSLKNGEELTVFHPILKEIHMFIKRETKIMKVLGVPTSFYGQKYTVRDNADTIHCEHEVLLNDLEMHEYIQRLCLSKTKKEYHFERKLQEKGLQVGNLIEFQDGKQAVIVSLSDDCPDIMRSLFYLPLKKDGTPSKVKPRILYGNTIYKIVN